MQLWSTIPEDGFPYLNIHFNHNKKGDNIMKYNGFYYRLFASSMKKVIAEKYGKEYANEIMKKSKKIYREIVEKADDIGDDNPMAYNELFALAFVSP